MIKSCRSDLFSSWVICPWHIWNMLFDLLFLNCLWYLNETSHICFSPKVTYCDLEQLTLWPFHFMIYLPLIYLTYVFWPVILLPFIIPLFGIFYDLAAGLMKRVRFLAGYSWPSRAWKNILLAFLSTFWHPCSKCILMCFKKDRGGCQVWKFPQSPIIRSKVNWVQILVYTSDFSVFIN